MTTHARYMRALSFLESKKLSDLDQILVPKGTLIHIDGMPFEIKEDTYVLGFAENAKLTTQLKAGAKNVKHRIPKNALFGR